MLRGFDSAWLDISTDSSNVFFDSFFGPKKKEPTFGAAVAGVVVLPVLLHACCHVHFFFGCVLAYLRLANPCMVAGWHACICFYKYVYVSINM